MTTAEGKADTMTHAVLSPLSMRLLVRGRRNTAPAVVLGRDAKAVSSKMLPSQKSKKTTKCCRCYQMQRDTANFQDGEAQNWG